MRCLVDTHVLLWWLHDSASLRPEARALIASGDNELLWSAASTWELGIKQGLGKLRLGEPLGPFVFRILSAENLRGLAIQHAHVVQAAGLPLLHRDPFDRLLVAQAMVEGVPLITRDQQLAAYGIECIQA